MEEDLICPITLELFKDPITVPCCGTSFDRASIIKQRICPICRKKFENFDPINYKIIENYINTNQKSDNITITENILNLIKTKQLSREKYLTLDKIDITECIQEEAFINNIITFDDLDFKKTSQNFIVTLMKYKLTKEQYFKIPTNLITNDAIILALQNNIITLNDRENFNEHIILELIARNFITNEQYKNLVFFADQ